MTYLYQLTERCDQQIDAATTLINCNFKRDNYFTRRARLRHFHKRSLAVYGRGVRVMLRLESLDWSARHAAV